MSINSACLEISVEFVKNATYYEYNFCPVKYTIDNCLILEILMFKLKIGET
jgi:hypothetical protein